MRKKYVSMAGLLDFFCNAADDFWRHSLLDCTLNMSSWALVDEEITEHMAMSQMLSSGCLQSASLWIMQSL
jgi:hypothetical protein